MSYTISQAAQMTGISPSAIRYYDKEGLLPQVERKNGIRLFSDMDIRWLHLLTCLKNTGMPIKRIREYAELAQRGDESLKERQALIRQQRQGVFPPGQLGGRFPTNQLPVVGQRRQLVGFICQRQTDPR